MPNEVTPELLNFIITLCQFMLIAFGIMIAGAALVYTTLFWKGNFSGAMKFLPRSSIGSSPSSSAAISIIRSM